MKMSPTDKTNLAIALINKISISNVDGVGFFIKVLNQTIKEIEKD